MMPVYHHVSQLCSRITTKQYSSSFSSAIKLLNKDLRNPIYNIYGFVRFADEIVDTFHDYNKADILKNYKEETYKAISNKISINPILHSFQLTVNEYAISLDLIEAFFQSMEMDLEEQLYTEDAYNQYIYGSAETVGLMCLYVFCDGDQEKYDQLKPAAQSLGAAFQKVNFLRDVKSDYNLLKRTYFPGVDFYNFTREMKNAIEDSISGDFKAAYSGIMKLPWKAKFGVYVAYKYYLSLFYKIKKLKPAHIMEERIRIPNYRKAIIVLRAGLENQLNLIQ
jgi:phytoene/squalene synthetase